MTITTATAGANMRYTVNGTTPSETNGALIAASSGSVSVTPTTDGTTLQAIAFKAGMSDSDVSAATYNYIGGNMPNPGGTDSNQNSVSPGYDGNGNLTSYKGWVYVYDAQNRLTSARNNGVQVASFYYDGKNRQIARNINGVIRVNVWDAWELLEEYASPASRTAAYLQGEHGVITSWGANGTFYYYQDKLGSTTHIANANGTLLESYHYDLYGTPAETSTLGVVDLYAGERWIPELGLYDLRNRFMSPELGRFLQADPIGFKGDASNLYRYCHNDPEDFTDPTGLASEQGKALGDFLWEHLIWERGNAQDTFNSIWNKNFQPAGMIMAPVSEKNEGEKKGLKVRYAGSYPSKGSGGRPVVERALKRLQDTARGRFFYSQNAHVTIYPTDRDHRTGARGDLRNFALYLNPNDDRFYDSESYRAFSKYRGEIPPATDEGRAAIIGHEFGHGLFNSSDEDKGGRNVRDNENPVRAELDIPLRRSYGGHQFRIDE